VVPETKPFIADFLTMEHIESAKPPGEKELRI
jgi:hypothetical protein